MRLTKKIAKSIVISSALCFAMMGQVSAQDNVDNYWVGTVGQDNTLPDGTYYTVCGGRSDVDVSNTSLTIESGTITQEAIAGFASNGNSYGNKLIFNNGTFGTDSSANSIHLIGGLTSNGAAYDNHVKINGGNILSGEVVGGASNSDNYYDGKATDANAYNNEVVIYNINENSKIQYILGGASHNYTKTSGSGLVPYSSSANYNNVEIWNNNSSSTDVAVGYADLYVPEADASSGYTASASNNTMTVYNGSLGKIALGYINVWSNSSSSLGDLSNSKLSITGNSIDFYGGSASAIAAANLSVDLSASSVIPGDISNNKINLYGGTVDNVCLINSSNLTSDVVKGIDLSYNQQEISSQYNITVANNSVDWYGGDISNGVLAYTNASNVPLIGTSFNFHASSNNIGKYLPSLAGFKHYNFYICRDLEVVDNETTLIKLTNPIDLSGATIGVGINASSDNTNTPVKMQVGQSIILINAQGISNANLVNDTSDMTKYTSDSKLRSSNVSAQTIDKSYDFDLSIDGGDLKATLKNATANDQADSLMSARNAEAFMIYDKLDIVEKAYQDTVVQQKTVNHINTMPVAFYDFDYSDTHTNDGDKLRGYNFVVGAASTAEDSKANILTKGIFLEYGDNSFSADDNYANGRVLSSGKGEKIGAGVLLRKKFFDGHYFDTYLRIGSLKTKYDGWADGVGNIKYNNTDMYYGAHLAYGRMTQMTPVLNMNVYGRYFFTYIPGHSTDADVAYTAGGTDTSALSFDPLYIHRFRVGSKFTWDYRETKHYLFYTDVALEHQLSNTQSGFVNDSYVERSNGSDTTAVFELGYEDSFGPKGLFKFKANLKGYAGTRNGLGGGINLSINF